MIIKKRIPVESLPASMETVSTLYPDPDLNLEDRESLTSIVQVLTDFPETFRGNYTCYIEQNALNEFIKHANAVYDKLGNEATGLFVGYYLHSLEDNKKKIAIATKFLPSYENTAITCEQSYEEVAQNNAFCEYHKLLPLVWPHTHPFNRPLFYSSTDSNTLAKVYSAPHQMGVVCDNLRNDYMGFKIINGKECHESLYSLDIKKSLDTGILTSETLYKAPIVFGESKKVAVAEDNAEAPKTASDDFSLQTEVSELKTLVERQSKHLKDIRLLLVLIATFLIMIFSVMFMLYNKTLTA